MTVNPGDQIQAQSNASAPTIQWDSEEGVNYTLIVTVADAPFFATPQKLQWLVLNIQGNNVTGGLTVAEYFDGEWDGADKSSNITRYTVLVYKQLGELSYNGEATPARFVEQQTPIYAEMSMVNENNSFILFHLSKNSYAQQSNRSVELPSIRFCRITWTRSTSGWQRVH